MNWGAFFLDHLLSEIALVLLVLSSGFFSGSETAFFSLTRGQLFHLSQSDHTLHRLVSSLVRQPQKLLNSILLGNLVVNIAYSAVSALIIIDLQASGAPGWSLVAAPFVPLMALILLGEVTPKMLAYAVCQRWAEAAAAPLALMQRAFAPILWLLDVFAI